MPGLDGTGPAGQGPRTGRGQGRCNYNWQGRGMGRGQRAGQCFNYPNLQGMPAQDELTLLKNQASVVENHLSKVKNRISELEQE